MTSFYLDEWEFQISSFKFRVSSSERRKGGEAQNYPVGRYPLIFRLHFEQGLSF
jgi:hypothetical protein